MRHYEVVFLIHSDWYGFVNSIITNYKNIVENNKGVIHRCENWGRRLLSYPIKNTKSAFYVLMNIECSVILMQSLAKSLHFNEAVIRNLIIRKDFSIKDPSQVITVIKNNSI